MKTTTKEKSSKQMSAKTKRASKPVRVRKTAKAAATAGSTRRKTAAAKKAPVRRATRTSISKVKIAELIENPAAHSVPLEPVHAPAVPFIYTVTGSAPEQPPMETARRRYRNAAVATFAVFCGAALVVAGALSFGSVDNPANVIPATAPSVGSVRPVEPVSTTPTPDSKLGEMVHGTIRKIRAVSSANTPQMDVSWAKGVIQERMNRVAGIYSIEAAAGSAPAGMIALHLDVEPDGHIGRAWLESDSLNDTEFSNKVIREFIKTQFMPTGLGQTAGLIVPIEFGSAGIRLLTVAAHDEKMPGDAALPQMPAVAAGSRAADERSS